MSQIVSWPGAVFEASHAPWDDKRINQLPSFLVWLRTHCYCIRDMMYYSTSSSISDLLVLEGPTSTCTGTTLRGPILAAWKTAAMRLSSMGRWVGRISFGSRAFACKSPRGRGQKLFWNVLVQSRLFWSEPLLQNFNMGFLNFARLGGLNSLIREA